MLPALISEEEEEMLPDTWTWAPIAELADVQNGRAFPSAEYCDEGVRLLRPGNLHGSGRIEWNELNTVHLPDRWARQFPEFVLSRGELLINLTAQSLKDEFLGRACVKGDDLAALLNQRIGRFRPFGADDLRPYLFVYLKSPRFRSYVNTLDTGSLIRHTHTKQVLAHQAPLPPLPEQREIVRQVGALFKLADAVEQRVARAAAQAGELSQAIFAKAFRGELVPTEAELARQEYREYEPASVLLERIKRERTDLDTTKSPNRTLAARRHVD